MQNIKSDLLKEINKNIFGQEDLIELLIISIFLESNVLLHGLPGLGKTKLANTIAKTCNLDFKRVQFTPDLMPSDIVGFEMYESDSKGKKKNRFIKGPVFTNLLLADEINRTPPKTQSALLEAMQEKQVTIMGQTFPLERPFVVIATENPVELEGTYSLPEAQMDRFLFCLNLTYPNKKVEEKIVEETTAGKENKIKNLLDSKSLLEIKNKILSVLVSKDVNSYAVDICQQSRPEQSKIKEIKQYVNYGAGPRGSQSLILAAKGKSFLEGRKHVNFSDIDFVAEATLRHRISCNFNAKSEGIESKDIIDILIKNTKKNNV